LRFPFLVYCAHRETLALILSTHESTTFHCAPPQLQGLLAHLNRQRTALPSRNAASSSAGEPALR
jgi:hypothetical protein